MDLSSSESDIDDMIMGNFDSWVVAKSNRISTQKSELVEHKEKRNTPDEIPRGAKIFDLSKKKKNKKQKRSNE